MKRGVPLVVIVAALLAGVAADVSAAGKAVHIGYVFPAGGCRGTNVVVKIGGENIYKAKIVQVSGEGVHAEVLDSKDPEEGKPDTKKKNKKGTVIDEVITVRIAIDPDAQPGNRDLCVIQTNEASNKLVFQVGSLPEVTDQEPDNKPATATPLPALPVLAQGQIMPGDVDCFKFHARRGQRLVCEVSARSLMPYIADGVPGWFQAIVSLKGGKGEEVAVADDFLFNQDPVLFFDVPEDGPYTLTIHDTLYRGREDFVYRIRIGELPFITGLFPLGAALSSNPVPVRVSGVNLPDNLLTVSVDSMVPACRHICVTNGGQLSNTALFQVGEDPEIIETKPALKARKARTITTPVVINGCLRVPGDRHYYRFFGKAGETVALEVMARRLGSPLDSCVAILNARGRKVAENDDVKDKGEGYLTHQADSELTTTLPEDGPYTALIYDTQGNGGENYAYRLRIGPPRPDFELRMTPAAVGLPAGSSAQVSVQAIRRGGFKGEIHVVLQNPGNGVSLEGGTIAAGFDKALMTLTAAPRASGHLAPRFFGTAEIGGRIVTRPVVPAENLMQAFLYQHLLPFQEETVVIPPGEAPFYFTVKMPTNGIVELPVGRDVTLPLTVVRSPGHHGAIRLQPVEQVPGLTFRNISIGAHQDSAQLSLRAETRTPTNQSGVLLFTGTMQVEREATQEERKRIEERQAREKEAKEAAARSAMTNGVTNAWSGTVTGVVAVAGASTGLVNAASSTNLPSALPSAPGSNLTSSASASSAKERGQPVTVKRPVTMLGPAIVFRITEKPVPKPVETKPAAPKANASQATHKP